MLLSIKELAIKSGISSSYLSRIEHNERFPSANILRKLSKPLGIPETDLLMIAGFLSHNPRLKKSDYILDKRLDPYVAYILAQEPVDIQRAAIKILNLLKQYLRIESTRMD